MIIEITEVLFFDHRYRFTTEQFAAYRVEIDKYQLASFYKGIAVTQAFYKEPLTQLDSTQQRLFYLSLTLKSLIEIPD